MERQTALHLLILLIFGSALVALFWSGYNSSFDDALYMKFSAQVLAGTFNQLSSPYAYGSLFVYSLASFQAFLGTIGPSVLQALEYLAITISIYFTLKAYFTPKIALTTALCLEASIFILGYASRVLPDMLLGLFISLVFLILAYKPKSYPWMLIAGLISGLTVAVKFGGFVALLLLGLKTASSILVAGILFVCTYLIIANLKRATFIAGLFLAILLFQLLTPSSLLGMVNVYLTSQVRLSQANLQLNLETMTVNLILYNFEQLQIFPIGAILIFAVMGTAMILWKKERRLYFAVLAFWASFLYLYLGTESFTHYAFITVESRYFIELCAPMCILAGAFLSSLRKWASENQVLFYAVLITMVSNLPMYVMFFFNRLPTYTL